MDEKITIKNNRLVYTKANGTEAMAIGVVTRSNKAYSFTAEHQNSADNGKKTVMPSDIYAQDGYVFVTGHSKAGSGEHLRLNVLKLNFVGFTLSAYDLESIHIVPPPVSPARLSVVPARPDEKSKKSGMIPPFGWFRP